jgi:hypothetical protein
MGFWGAGSYCCYCCLLLPTAAAAAAAVATVSSAVATKVLKAAVAGGLGSSESARKFVTASYPPCDARTATGRNRQKVVCGVSLLLLMFFLPALLWHCLLVVPVGAWLLLAYFYCANRYYNRVQDETSRLKRSFSSEE